MKVGVITGMVEEATRIRPEAGRLDTARHCYYRDASPELAIACFGIGKVNGAMAAGLLIDQGCTLLLSAGVAGRLSEREGEVFWVSEAVQHDYGALRPGGIARFRAGALPFGEARLEAFRAIADPGLGLPHARIATGDLFVECADQSLRLAGDVQADLVDMETAAIAQVAERHGLRWGAIRAVSDDADDGSAASFRDNIDRAAARSAHYIDRLLRLLD